MDLIGLHEKSAVAYGEAKPYTKSTYTTDPGDWLGDKKEGEKVTEQDTGE